MTERRDICDCQSTISPVDILTSVLGLVGSPRENGRTAVIVRYALEVLKRAGFQTKEVSFSNARITPCGIGRHYDCSRRPTRCPVNDDASEIYDMFRAADLIIVGSPVYGGLLPSIMYAFKERAQALASNWPLRGKDVVLLLNCSWGCERPMNDLERHFGAHSTILGKTVIPDPHTEEKTSQLTDDECDKIKETLSSYLSVGRNH